MILIASSAVPQGRGEILHPSRGDVGRRPPPGHILLYYVVTIVISLLVVVYLEATSLPYRHMALLLLS